MGISIGLAYMFCMTLILLDVVFFVYYTHLLVFQGLCIPNMVTRILIAVVPDLQ